MFESGAGSPVDIESINRLTHPRFQTSWDRPNSLFLITADQLGLLPARNISHVWQVVCDTLVTIDTGLLTRE